MLQVARRLTVALLLILGGSSLPLLSSLRCLNEDDGGEDCYASFDEGKFTSSVQWGQVQIYLTLYICILYRVRHCI